MNDESKTRPAIQQAREQWEQTTVAKTTDRFPERRVRFDTVSGEEIDRLYTPPDDSGSSYLDKLGFPGEYPFTRGVQPTMYRGRLWTMRQYAGFSTAEESNKRYRYLLKQGSTGLSVAFDLPTQIGYDSDDPMAKGEIGKVVLKIDNLKKYYEVAANAVFGGGNKKVVKANETLSFEARESETLAIVGESGCG